MKVGKFEFGCEKNSQCKETEKKEKKFILKNSWLKILKDF